MAVALYLDHHVPRAIAVGLRLQAIDVLTAQEDGASQMDDAELLDRAQELQRLLFSQDDDLVREAVRRQREAVPFSGVIYAHQLQVSIGGCVRDLALIAQAGEPEDVNNQIIFLPL